MTFSFIRTAKFFLPLSLVLSVASIVLLFVPGPKMSIEFTGGTLMEIRLSPERTRDDLDRALETFGVEGEKLSAVSITKTRDETYYLRTQTLSNEEHLALLDHLRKELDSVQELQYTTIGPTVGSTLKRRALWSLAIATVAIIGYIALAFRKIPTNLSPWRFGTIAVIALIHDDLIIVGIFTVLSHYTTFQVDTLFISALLSIMGYSVNDTIVIFDRIRDNLREQGRHMPMAELVDLSLHQTFTRTLNTGFGALIMLFALFILGAESIRWFVLTLILGTIIGTYSSFYIAAPLLVYSQKKATRS